MTPPRIITDDPGYTDLTWRWYIVVPSHRANPVLFAVPDGIYIKTHNPEDWHVCSGPHSYRDAEDILKTLTMPN